MNPPLIAGAREALLARLEAVLPQPPAAPDWSASIAFATAAAARAAAPSSRCARSRRCAWPTWKEVDGRRSARAQHRAVRRRPRPTTCC